MKNLRKEQGITLVALVVTIVVLLILAATSLSMLTGENGIITRAQNAKNETDQGEVEELVSLAVSSLKSGNNVNEIKPNDIANEINNSEGRTDVYAEKNSYPTNIIFPNNDNRKVEVNLTGEVDFDEILNDLINNPDIYYDEAQELGQNTKQDIGIGTDGKVVNLDLWDYYKTDTGEEMRLGHQRASSFYSGYVGNIENGKIIGKIPQYIYVASEGKVYTVTQLIGTFSGKDTLVEIPDIPKTITTLEGTFEECSSLKNVTIPDGVTYFGFNTFKNCTRLTSITIPKSLTNIAGWTFYRCDSLEIVNYTGTEEQWNMIFIGDGNEYLTNATINFNYTK